MKFLKGLCITIFMTCFWSIFGILVVFDGKDIIAPLVATVLTGAWAAYFAVKLEKKGV